MMNSINWKGIVKEIVKYSIGAVLGALGITFTGCTAIPIFNF